ncbi:MAG: helix-turn-helix domain-containing protein [Hydrogenovibrio sp.]|jgi:putative transcriptional regulator
MIRCNLSTLMGQRKLKISDVSRDTGIHRNTISLLYKEEATRIELKVVEQLCRYFDCEIGEFFEIVDESEN